MLYDNRLDITKSGVYLLVTLANDFLQETTGGIAMANELNRREFLKMAGAAAVAVSVSGMLAGCGDEAASPSNSEKPSSSGSASSGSGASSKPGSSSSSSSGASSETKPAKIIWIISANGDGTATLEGYDSAGATPSGEVTLPTKVSGSVITKVNFNLGNKVTKLIIPGTIKKVYRIADDNLNLREVIIQEGLEQLGAFSFADQYQPFAGCKNLSKVQLPNSLKVIEERCFAGCASLKSIILPEGLEKIGSGAFENSGLTSVVIPSTVTELSRDAFAKTSLKEATIKCGKDGWGSSGAGNSVFAYCDKLEKITFNDKTTEIAGGMFRNCTSLKTISLPKSLEYIGYEAFKGCTNLKLIVIPENVTGIASEAFNECTSLQKVNILGPVTKIDVRTFKNCSALQSIFIPMTVNEIAGGAFEGCSNLQDVYYPLSESAWTNIRISGDGNVFLTAADLHTNALPMAL